MSRYVEPRVDRGELSFEGAAERLGIPKERIGLFPDRTGLDLWSTPAEALRSMLSRMVQADERR